jgi:ubiquinol-cytochrome c reductase cytochrome c1 subunit
MKKLLTICVLLCLPVFANAAGGDVHLEKADINLENKSSLRHGAKLFVNYCLSCHSASFMRYNRMAKDLALTDDQVENNMMFVADFNKLEAGEAKKIGDLMTVAMTKKDGEKYFGTAVPDLSVIARAKGADYLYTYLTTFYLDENRPFGVNNTTFANASMPHVLWKLEGLKKLVGNDEDGKPRFEYVTKGKMSEADYKAAVTDLVNFMVYMGEPIKLERQRTGIFVMFFLVIFFLFAYLLKKEYWKDVH